MEIIWSKRAIRSLEEIQSGIKLRFSLKEEERFLIEVVQTISSIRKFPKGFPEGKKPNQARMAVIHPNTTLFYRIRTTERIELLLFWENRRNPKKLK